MLQRLGFPAVGRHRRFVGAIAIDAIGSGVWAPVSVLYFVGTTDLSLARIGFALTVAAAVAIPFALLAGPWVDRFGAKTMVQVGNLLSFLGFASYPFAQSVPAVAVAAGSAALGRSLFWAAFSGMVVEVADVGEREKWFGFLGALRNAGFGIGGVLAAVAITVRDEWVFHGIAVANASSYLLAAALMSAVATSGARRVSQRPAGAWREVIHDRAYRWLVLANVGYAMGCLTLNIAMPVYLVERLSLPGWIAGAVYVINTALIGITQGLVVERMTGRVRSRLVEAAAGFMIAAFALLMIADPLQESGGVGVLVACVVVLIAATIYTLGEMVGGPVLTAMAAEAPPEHLRGRYLSTFQLSWNVTSALAPALYLWLLDQSNGLVWTVVTGIVLAGALCCLPLRRRLPLAADTVSNGVVTSAPSTA